MKDPFYPPVVVRILEAKSSKYRAWQNERDPNSPWYIEEYLGVNDLSIAPHSVLEGYGVLRGGWFMSGHVAYGIYSAMEMMEKLERGEQIP